MVVGLVDWVFVPDDFVGVGFVAVSFGLVVLEVALVVDVFGLVVSTFATSFDSVFSTLVSAVGSSLFGLGLFCFSATGALVLCHLLCRLFFGLFLILVSTLHE